METLIVGEYLKRKREDKGLSLKYVAQKLNVRIDYLENLEAGRYEQLPPQVYTRGLLRSYADFLEVDTRQIVKMYNKEIVFVDKTLQVPSVNNKKVNALRDIIVVTPKLLTVIATIIIFSVVFYYLYHQINSFNAKPYLFVNQAIDSVEVVTDRNFIVSGVTEKNISLFINGEVVLLDENGGFRQEMFLLEGRNVFVIEAKNRFNHIHTKTINVIYEKREDRSGTIQEVIDN